MPISVMVTRDFDHMSRVAGDFVKKHIIETLKKKKECVLGLATGNSPTGLYRYLARSANAGEWDSSRIRSFNLDEYVGLPGENPQQRLMHPESYCHFMIQAFFGLLDRKFMECNLPCGSLVDQKRLAAELRAHPEDWREVGSDAGKWVRIKPKPVSDYLAWLRKDLLLAYAQKIKRAGGIDIHIIGVGGRGHVAFHEAGIPFRGSQVMLVKLDDNTVNNAVADGHFASSRECPLYAITMGAELVYRARTVVLLACGDRKSQPVARSLLDQPGPHIPISYGQIYGQNGGNLLYVVDDTVGRELLSHRTILEAKGIMIHQCSE